MLKMTSAALALAATCFLFAPANAATVTVNHGLVSVSKSLSGAIQVRRCKVRKIRRCHIGRHHRRVCRVVTVRKCVSHHH